jgi:hypothetical protein
MSRGTEENRPYVVDDERERDELGHGEAPLVARDRVSEVSRALAASRARAINTYGSRSATARGAGRTAPQAACGVGGLGASATRRALGVRPTARPQRADCDTTPPRGWQRRRLATSWRWSVALELRPETGLRMSRRDRVKSV